jgi:hypothetical protein
MCCRRGSRADARWRYRPLAQFMQGNHVRRGQSHLESPMSVAASFDSVDYFGVLELVDH